MLLLLGVASAHIAITSHEMRYSAFDIKEPPCGLAENEPGAVRYELEPGATLVLEWEETIDHPGHYRIAFDPDGDAGFVDPQGFDDLYTNDLVLYDGIEDHAGREGYAFEVTLPDVSCETCTLQLIQVMTDKPPWGDGDDLYYNCVDLRLVEGAVGDTVAEGDKAACGGCSGAGVGGSWVLALVLLLRRRRGLG